MEKRNILHCDCNNFFASCECLQNPDIKDKPVVVAGKVEERHGVIIAKNYIAKSFGIQTGMRIFEAQRVCPNLVVIEPHMDLYNYYSEKVYKIYTQWTDRVESFSIDECFLDVTHSKIFGSPVEIADKIREQVKNEIGLTISVGVSFCKIFAKIGSDIKKPDATTEITRQNYKDIVWKLPIEDMIGVGRHTKEKFDKFGISTIGDLANFPQELLVKKLGKVGKDLCLYANGVDDRSVSLYYEHYEPKSVGNSATYYRDLKTRDEVLMAFNAIAESVVKRMKEQGIYKAQTLQIIVKNNELKVYQKQCKLVFPCRDSKIFAHTAYNMFVNYYDFKQNVRLLGISVTDFLKQNEQLCFFEEYDCNLDDVVLKIRDKYGYNAICKANSFLDRRISGALNRAGNYKELREIPNNS